MAYIDPSVARRATKEFYTTPKGKDDDDIVEYEVRQVVKKVGDGEEDFVIEDKVVEVSRVNRQAWIAKDAADVGILNIIEKVRRSGDVTLFNQLHGVIPEGVQDYTNIPDNIGDAINVLKTGGDSFAALKAIFGDVSFETLANMTQEELNQYLANYMSAQQPKESEK